MTLVAALTVAAPHQAHADPASWQHLCRGLGEFAGLLTNYRNQGRDLHEAVAAAFPELHVMPDPTVAAEVAQQVYATPGLDRDQEVAAIYTKCLTPAKAEAPAGQQPAMSIAELTPIPLQPGPNHVERFASDGRDANITLAWRDEGGGRGQDMFVVTMPARNGTGWRSVDMLQSSAAAPSNGTMTDEPHRGNDMLRSLRFARGRVNGEDATLLLIASRAESTDPAPSVTVYEVYRLVQTGGGDSFERVVQNGLPGRYCNADMALSAASGLPLRSSYRGPRNVDGTFTKDGCDSAKPMTGHGPLATADSPTAPLPGPVEQPKNNPEQLFQQFSGSNDGRAPR